MGISPLLPDCKLPRIFTFYLNVRKTCSEFAKRIADIFRGCKERFLFFLKDSIARDAGSDRFGGTPTQRSASLHLGYQYAAATQLGVWGQRHAHEIREVFLPANYAKEREKEEKLGGRSDSQ